MIKILALVGLLAVVVVCRPRGEGGHHEFFAKYLSSLPEEHRKKIEDIKASAADSRERHEKVREYIDSLPSDLRPKFPPPKFIAKLPADVQAQLKAIHEDESLSSKDRFAKFRAVIDALPEDVKKNIPKFGGHKR